jgi:hypothetical protein
VSSNGKSFHIFAFIGYKQYRSIVPIPWLFDSRDIHPCYFKELEEPDYDEDEDQLEEEQEEAGEITTNHIF